MIPQSASRQSPADLPGPGRQTRCPAASYTTPRDTTAELVDLVLEHYEQFDSRYKGLVPLKRVHIPEPIQESGE